jgi:tetratricopeptide (TPR) repeat protein
MVRKTLTVVCLILPVFWLAGCDPESLVARKVPAGLKDMLRSTEVVKAIKKEKAAKKAATIKLQIVSPMRGAFYPAELPVVFKANVASRDVKVSNKNLTWTAVPVVAKKPVPKKEKPAKGRGGKAKHKPRSAVKPVRVGTGKDIKKKLEPGSYQLTLVLAIGKEIRITRKTSFLVAPSFTGRVLHGDRGLAGAVVAVRNFQGKMVGKPAKTGKDGRFYVPKPGGKGSFKLTVNKGGFGFDPPYFIVSTERKHPRLEFHGAAAKFSDIRLTESEGSTESVQEFCPAQKAVLKGTIEAESPLSGLKVYLVPPGTGSSSPLLVGSTAYGGAGGPPSENSARLSMKIDIPVGVAEGVKQLSYGIRIAATEANGNRFAWERPGMVVIDNARCVVGRLAQAVSAQQAGKLEEAARLYDLIERYHANLGDPSALARQMEKTYFDRGLAHLGIAMGLDSKDIKRHGYLAKALADFKKVLSYHGKDAEAYLFRGLIRQMTKNYDAAIELYTSAMAHRPELALAYELRGLTYLETGIKKNLEPAVDDFTAAITLNPKNSALRKTRRAALALDVKSGETPENFVLDTSSVPVPPLEKQIKLSAFCRR